jgi:hypothetical protein
MNSLVGKYFGQALEFLKQSIPVTNELYNDKFRFELIDGVVYLTNYVHEFGGEFWDIDGEHAYLEEMDSINLEDIMNERWYIYESQV